MPAVAVQTISVAGKRKHEPHDAAKDGMMPNFKTAPEVTQWRNVAASVPAPERRRGCVAPSEINAGVPKAAGRERALSLLCEAACIVDIVPAQ